MLWKSREKESNSFRVSREQTEGASLYEGVNEDGLGAGSVNHERDPEASVTRAEWPLLAR